MLDFQVAGMTCGHCEATVTRAVRSVDPTATVVVDRASGRVSVETAAEPAALQRAIESEGYKIAAGR